MTALPEDPFDNNAFLTISDEKRFSFSKEKKEAILKQIKSFLSRYPVIEFAYAHGSFLAELPCRDIDIAVYYDDSLTGEKQLELSLSLSAVLSRRLRLPVDVHALNQSPLGFQYYATRGLVVVSRNDEKRYDFVENTWLKYLDYKPVLKECLRDLLTG